MTLNTNATTSWRAKWFQTNLQETLKAALVAEKICAVDRSGSKYINNPYGSAVTITQQSLSGGAQGTYSVGYYTSTDDILTVTDEFIYAEQIYDFETVMQHGDIMTARMDEIIAKTAIAIDKFVVNVMLDTGTGTITTDSGGFNATNTPKIIADIIGATAGYADTVKGLYLVVEATDVSGIVQAGMSNGFSFADAWLNNGFVGNIGGVDIYVVQAGTFVTATLGSTAVVCSGHRLAGVKGVATYAQPQGITWEEKAVSGKTGKEIMAAAYCGVKGWYQKLVLTIDITLTA